MYNPVTEKDMKQGEYLDVLENVRLSLFTKFNVKQILFNETFYCLDSSKKSVIKGLVKSLFFKDYRLQSQISGKDILLLYTHNYRADHDGYWNKIKNDVSSYDEITIFTRKERKLQIKSFFKRFRHFLTCYKELKGIEDKNNRLYLVCQLVNRKSVLDEIEAMNLHPKLVMCFFDSAPNESVLMQYFKNKCAITVTNQHGLCVFQSCLYDRMDQSQILNFKSDYFLARSKKQKEQFILAGYNPEKIKIVGFIGASSQNISMTRNNVIGIYLDCPTLPLAEDNNNRMIKIVIQLSDRTGMKYLVKCHPADSIDRYKVDENCIGIYGKGTSLDETFKQVDICITHASATYVDVYNYGLRCLKMNSELPYPIAMKEDEFFTAEEAAEKIKSWRSLSIKEKENYINKVREEYSAPWNDGNIRRELEKIMADNALVKE